MSGMRKIKKSSLCLLSCLLSACAHHYALDGVPELGCTWRYRAGSPTAILELDGLTWTVSLPAHLSDADELEVAIELVNHGTEPVTFDPAALTLRVGGVPVRIVQKEEQVEAARRRAYWHSWYQWWEASSLSGEAREAGSSVRQGTKTVDGRVIRWEERQKDNGKSFEAKREAERLIAERKAADEEQLQRELDHIEATALSRMTLLPGEKMSGLLRAEAIPSGIPPTSLLELHVGAPFHRTIAFRCARR